MDIPFITLAEVKQYVSVQSGNTEFDEQLNDLRVVCSRLISEFCRRDFEKQEYTQYFETRFNKSYPYDLSGDSSNDSGLLQSNDIQRFSLRAYPVDLEADFKVYYDTTRVFAESSLLTNNTDYFFNEDTNAVISLIGTVTSPRAIKVVYTAGYEVVAGELSAALPENLKLGCATQIMYLFDKIQTNSLGVASQSEEQGKSFVGTNLLIPEVREIVKPYKRLLYGKR